MTSRQSKILVIDGHPDADAARLSHALADAYECAAQASGADVRKVRLADLDFTLLRHMADFMTPPEEPDVLAVRRDVEWAEHLVFVFPLWLGSAPALLRGLLEQVARGGFVAEVGPNGWKQHLRNKSARLIVTMGMPSLAYGLIFGAHGVKSIAQSILGFGGVAPIRLSLFGGFGGDQRAIGRIIAKVTALGGARH
jgi:putative NADPH-quinone reductase